MRHKSKSGRGNQCPLSGVKRTLCGLAVTLLSTQADILIALTDICAFECFRDKADISE